MYRTAALISSLAAAAYAQQVGTNTPETHPPLPMQSCSAGGSCTTLSTSVVLDANWRWLHNVGGYTNCYTGNTWSATLCPDGVTCAANCALDGGDYAGTYGITTSGNALSLGFVTKGANTNVGSRTYLMDSPTTYKIFKLKGQEFTFDVDVSTLPCGLNGALYFVEMDADGGLSKYPTNKAGAAYGTGYCDSQCPQDIKFIDGVANSVGWVGDSNSANAGTGMYGSCCTELDIWEANKISEAYTPHPCSVMGQTRCSGNDCGNASGERYAGVCDHDGCDFNSYRMGNETFYGPGMTVDTTKKITVVTQFITSDGTAAGTLTEIKRFYVQNGVVIPNSNSNVAGVPVQNYISDDWCVAQKTVFGDTNSFTAKGGLGAMGQSMDRGHVLVLSIWDDYAVNMLWLDSTYPTTGTGPGTQRGSCSTTSGAPTDVEAASPGAKVIFSNIKIGPIGSTFSGSTIGGGGGGSSTASSSSTKAPSSTSTPVQPTTTSTTPVKPTTTSTSTPVKPTTSSTSKPASSTVSTGTGPMATHWGQCAGMYYNGPTVCQPPWTCQYNSPYYSQCL